MKLGSGFQHSLRGLWLVAATATLLVASLADAQPSPPRDGGAPAGALTLYPGLRFESGFDSNVAYANSETSTSSGTVVVNPYLGIRTTDARLVDFQGDVGAAYERLLGQESGASSQSGTDLEGNVAVRVNPNGIVSVVPSNRVTWTNQPTYNLAGDAYRNLFNQFELGLGLHPGGYNRPARMGISGGLSFVHQLWRYETIPEFDRSAIGGRMELQWNFLPRTAVFTTAGVTSNSYEEASFQSTDATGTLREVSNTDSTAIRGSAGFTGLLTRRLSLLVSAGYGVGNYRQGDDAKTYLTHVDFGVNISDRSQASFGWEHNFDDTVVSSFLTYHRIYVRTTLDFGDLGLGVSGYLNLNDYSAAFLDTDELDVYGGNRNDTTAGGTAEITYTVMDWLTFGARYNPQYRTSTGEYALPTGDVGNLEYVSHRALAFIDIAFGQPIPLGGVSGAGESWLGR